MKEIVFDNQCIVLSNENKEYIIETFYLNFSSNK